MKGFIYYVAGHKASEEQAKQSYKSFIKYKWDVSLRSGITKHQVKEQEEFKLKIIENSRLHNFRDEDINRYLTKISCAINHIQFWKEVVKENQQMCFLEHDSICTMRWDDYQYDDYLLLNAEWVFKPPNKLGLEKFKNYLWPSFGVCDFPKNYPLKYHKENIWQHSMMSPGTGAYAITPSGAQKLLDAIYKHGFDQSDFMINSSNVRMQYTLPSPVKFNKVNLSLSYGL